MLHMLEGEVQLRLPQLILVQMLVHQVYEVSVLYLVILGVLLQLTLVHPKQH